MEFLADLHIHTSSSDGKQDVAEVLEKAQHSHLKTISVTDHDTIEALRKAANIGTTNGLEVISGVELSAIENNKDVHILGYFLDIENKQLLDKLDQFRQGRYDRGRKIVEKLNGLGVDLKFETVLKHAQDAPIGRVHIAEAMVEEELVYTFEEAFAKYIGYDGPAYSHKLEISVREAIALIQAAGGVAVLAHPGTLQEDDAGIMQLVSQGIEGLEVYHPDHDHTATKHYLELARQHNLLVTGGSDSHGLNHKRGSLGNFTIPCSYVRKLKEYKNRTSERSA